MAANGSQPINMHNEPVVKKPLKSYSSLNGGIYRRFSELACLFRKHASHSRSRARSLVERLREVEEIVEEQTGVRLHGLQVLDLGCGQQLRQAQYFALRNDVTAIDYSVIPSRMLDYWTLLRQNGVVRVIKTVGRKCTGSDRVFTRYLQETHPDQAIRPITVLQMDAAELKLEDEGFDFVYSRSVFEHLPTPERVAAEVRRVLKPGGVAYLGAHLYTCDSGCHDPRILSGRRESLPFWPHLRSRYASQVQPNSYLNKWRLAQYEGMFEAAFPGVHLIRFQRGADVYEAPLLQLRRRGELKEYSDEELLTDEIVAVWKKSASTEASVGP